MADNNLGKFPYDDASRGRINDYGYYGKLFLGHHFEAFNIRIDDEHYNKAYSKLRYVMVNFAGLISKICADMLFGEPVSIKVPGGDQDFIDALVRENKLDTQFYESALSNSAKGDALFKLRVGKRESKDDGSTVIIEDITPTIYFPEINGFNVREIPNKQKLAWTFKQNDQEYLREEIHTPGLIENKIYKMKGDTIELEMSAEMLGLVETQETGLDTHLLAHVPNWKTGDRFFGLSDYHDLDSIFYAINNRMTKTDNILDKHSDPILMVPKGVLDEKGNVNKKSLGVIEVEDGETGKPEYIVWDASLENAFKEVEKLVDFMMMIGEISPDALGMGQGMSDSGRAIKYKLMRTIAKVSRKKLYYDAAIKEVIYKAQLLAKAHSLKVGGAALKGEPVHPEIEWQDGLPIDISEQLENEQKSLDAGLTTKKAAIMRIYQVDEKSAEEILEERKDDNPIPEIKQNMADNPFKIDDK